MVIQNPLAVYVFCKNDSDVLLFIAICFAHLD